MPLNFFKNIYAKPTSKVRLYFQQMLGSAVCGPQMLGVLLGEKSAFEGQMIVKDTWQVCCIFLLVPVDPSVFTCFMASSLIIDVLVMFPIVAVLQLSVCHIMSLYILYLLYCSRYFR